MVLHEYGKPLEFGEVPDPVPDDNEIVIRVRGAGMCSTDVKIADGQLAAFIKLPFIPGHETAGEIVCKGKNAGNLEIGRKGVVYSIIGCGLCIYCRTGNENLCLHTQRIGFERNGGFAEYVKLPANNFCPFEKDMDFGKMAILPDAIGTPYHAFKKIAKPEMGNTVLIVGAGGLGIHAVQLARAMGAFVIACDISGRALDLAAHHGADICLDSSDGSAVQGAVLDVTRGKGADIVLEGVGKNATLSWSLKCLKKGGTLVVMGYDPVEPVRVPFIDMHNNEWKIAGTKITTRQDLVEVIELVEKGVVEPVVTKTMPLSEMNKGLDMVRNHRVEGRAVVKTD